MGLSIIERAKKLKELKSLLEKAKASKNLELAKTLKKIADVRQELGFNKPKSEPETPLLPNELYQSVIDGNTHVSPEVLQRMLAEYEKDPDHYQFVPAVQVLYDEYKEIKA